MFTFTTRVSSALLLLIASTNVNASYTADILCYNSNKDTGSIDFHNHAHEERIINFFDFYQGPYSENSDGWLTTVSFEEKDDATRIATMAADGEVTFGEECEFDRASVFEYDPAAVRYRTKSDCIRVVNDDFASCSLYASSGGIVGNNFCDRFRLPRAQKICSAVIGVGSLGVIYYCNVVKNRALQYCETLP